LSQILAGLHDKDINIALHYQALGNKPHAPTPGDPNGDGRVAAGRTSGRTSEDLDVRVPSMRELADGKAAYAAQTLGLLAKNSSDAAKEHKGLKEQLHDAEKRLARFSKAADDAHDALQKLKDDKDNLESSIVGSLEHDPFGGSLQDFETQTSADTNDAQAVLAALQQLVANGLDPHSQLFQRLAASGNVALIQQFAALSRSQLAAETAAFNSGQGALNAAGQFAGNAAFNDSITAQRKVTEHLDETVRHLTHTVNQLQHAVDHMGDKVKQGAHDGSKSGSEEGTRRGNDERTRYTGALTRTGAR
jgi:septal ring factor EnvC (AmiA/AmiB activator)